MGLAWQLGVGCCAAVALAFVAELEEGEEPCLLQASLGIEYSGGPQDTSAFSSAPNLSEAAVQSHEYVLIPHHKSGTVMSRRAADFISSLPAPLGLSVKAADMTMGFATDASMVQTARPLCLAQMGRNPFEMIVSGFLYHRSSAEVNGFKTAPFHQVIAADHESCEHWNEKGEMSLYCKGSKRLYGDWIYYHSIARVFRSSLAGPLSERLPDANPSESYPDYLKRIDWDAGLLAEFVFATNHSLEPMQFTFDFAASHPCGINVCFGEFYDNCGAAWQRLLQSWRVPEGQQHNAILGAAQMSCPQVDKEAGEHSSIAPRDDLRHPPLEQMVQRLRELDRLVLHGKIAALEQHVGCPLSENYR